MRLPRRIVGLGAVLAIAAAACGGEPSAEERRARLVDDLAGDLVTETGGALGEDEARCVAGRLVDDVGPDRFDHVVDAARGDTDPELRDQVIDAFAACDALEPLLEAG